MQSHRAVLITTASLGIVGLAALFFGTGRGDGAARTVAVQEANGVTASDAGVRASLPLAQPAPLAATSAPGKGLGVGFVDAQPVPIERGTVGELSAHVVDESGAPLPGVRVRFTRPGEASVAAASDTNGRLSVEGLVACGPWSFALPGHLESVDPGQVLEVITTGSRPHRITVRTPAPGTVISGRALDEDESPVANARVAAVAADGHEVGLATTDAVGAFFIVRGTGAQESALASPVHLSVTRAAGFDDLTSSMAQEWGAEDVVLHLRASGALRVMVVEAGTERPVEEFAVSWFGGATSTATLPGVVGRPETHAGGQALIEGVPAGSIRIVVTPSDSALAPNAPLEFDHTGAATYGGAVSEVRVELPRRERVLVRVHFADGRPAIGTQVELLASSDPERVGLATFALEPGRHAQLIDMQSHAMLCDSATTDANGEAHLGWTTVEWMTDSSPSDVTRSVRVTGKAHLPQVEPWSSPAGDDSGLGITVSAGATLSGVVRPLTVLDALAQGQLGRSPGRQGLTIVLTYTGDMVWAGSPARRRCRIDERGAFECNGLQPGPWTVQLSDVSIDPSRASNLSSKFFDSIEVQGEGTYDVELDVAELAPATLLGRVLVDGTAHGGRTVHLIRVVRDEAGQVNRAGRTTVTTDAEGRFTAHGLRPGRYHASIDGTGVPLIAPRAIDLEPGSSADETLRIDTGELRMRFRDAEGELLAGHSIVVTEPDTSFRATLTTDAEGLAGIEHIATGRYVVHAAQTSAGTAGQRLGEITIGSGSAPLPIEFTVKR